MQLLFFIITFTFFPQTLLAYLPNSSTGSQIPARYLSCPKINDLKKDPIKMVWFAKDGWLSYAASFATHIDKFLGAQWQGVNLGKITCLYASNQKMTFPIALEYNLLVYQPTGGNWTKNLGGYVNCKASNQDQCMFMPQIEPKVGDVYEQASQLFKNRKKEIGF